MVVTVCAWETIAMREVGGPLCGGGRVAREGVGGGCWGGAAGAKGDRDAGSSAAQEEAEPTQVPT